MEQLTTHGFTKTRAEKFAMIGADAVLYTHEKTGAQVMFLLNDDTNRVFQISFRTPAEDDRGIPHVLEHSVLRGSEKYPSKSLTFNLMFQTYNTYMNAATRNGMTSFPVASLSEKQLLRYTEYYLDSCFHSMVCHDESIFREEAWRYVLPDKDAELTISGNVYNEMHGAHTIQAAAHFNFLKEAFPGSDYANCSGGIPEHVPEITWTDLKEYHTEHYHPSNSFTCLYGKIDDVDTFLALLDSYFSQYNRKEYPSNDAQYKPLRSPAQSEYTYGVERSADVSHSAIASYGFICPFVSMEDRGHISFLSMILSSETSVFRRKMFERLPWAGASCSAGGNSRDTMLSFSASKLDQKDIEVFREIVEETAAQLLEEAISDESMDSIASAAKSALLLATESSSVGTDLIPSITLYALFHGDAFGYFRYTDMFNDFMKLHKEGVFKELIERYFRNNDRKVFVSTLPLAGQKETDAEELRKQLAKTKSAMQDEEIESIIASTNEAPDKADDSSVYIKQLQAVDIHTLPEEIREFSISDKNTDDGIRILEVQTKKQGIGNIELYLSAESIPQDKLHYFKLFISLLGELPTKKHSRQELQELLTKYLHQGEASVKILKDEKTGIVTPYLQLDYAVLEENFAVAYNTLYELVFETDISDVEKIKSKILASIASFKMAGNKNSLGLQMQRMFGRFDEKFALHDYMNGLDHYRFLQDVAVEIDADPQNVLQNLRSVQELLQNRTNAISAFSGNAAESNRACVDAFFARLPAKEQTRQKYTFAALPPSEAIAVDSAVQYNMIAVPFSELGLEKYSGALSALTGFTTDQILLPALRDRYGVYSVFHEINEDFAFIVSFRDRNIKETFDVYEALPDAMKSLEDMQEEELTGYILSAYSDLARFGGEISDGMDAIEYLLEGKTQQDKLQKMKDLKYLTKEKFLELSKVYTILAKKGARSTSGSSAKIESEKDLFDIVLRPFAEKE